MAQKNGDSDMADKQDMALVGWKDEHVEAAIIESYYDKFEIAKFKEECLKEGITKFERIPAKGVRLLHS